MILILTGANDRLQKHVIPVLEKKQAAFYRLDTADFPQRVGLTASYNTNQPDGWTLRGPAGGLELNRVRTVWYRRPHPPQPSDDLSQDDQDFVRRECEHCLTGLYHSLRQAFWVNPYDASRAGEHKPYQLRIARSVGLDVPRTLISNRPEQVLDFHKTCPDGMIYKTMTQYARRDSDDVPRGVYTTLIRPEQLEELCDQISVAPCIFQEYVPKRKEYRVTFIGRQVFVSEIDSQASEDTRVDWRRRIPYGLPPQRPADLPAVLIDRLRLLLEKMGLVFGCIDLAERPDGGFVFFEINPNGQWYWVEYATKLPLVDSFTDMLIQARPDYTPAHQER